VKDWLIGDGYDDVRGMRGLRTSSESCSGNANGYNEE